jgi:hypothetical protein
MAILAVAVVVIASLHHSTKQAESTCSSTIFARLADVATGSSGKNAVTTKACSGQWGIAAFKTTFPSEPRTQWEWGVAVFERASGTWRLIIGPSGGICDAAAPGTMCLGNRAQAGPIPHSALLSLVRVAGPNIDGEGDITPGFTTKQTGSICSSPTFARLADAETGPSGKNTITTYACSGKWSIAAFETTFPADRGTQWGVAVFERVSGTWRPIIGPSGGICDAAAPGTTCLGNRAPHSAIPHSIVLSLVREAGLHVDSEGDVTPG